MRLTQIIKENENLNKEYDVIINETTSKFWETLLEMHGKPLSESAIQNEVRDLEGMLFEVGLHLPDAQRIRFFEELQNPTQLNEGVMDIAKKVGGKVANAAASAQNAIDAGKKAVSNAVFNSVKHVWKNYIPQSVKDMGAVVAQKVGKMLSIMIEKAGKVLGKLANKLSTYGKKDPCFSGVSESMIDIEPMLFESTENAFFKGEKSAILLDNKEAFESMDIPTKVAKAISLTKKSGIDVYGRDLRGILSDVYRVLVSDNQSADNVLIGTGKATSMAKYFKDNGIKQKIKKFENGDNPQVDTETGENFCEMKPGFIDKFFGSDSEIGRAWVKLGLDKESSIGSLVSKLSENKTSLFVTLGSLVLTFASGAGALRIAGLVFASVIPLIISARIDTLKERGAPEDQIEFWEKARSISKFVNTVIQIFNIGNLIANGWSATTDLNADTLQKAEVIVDLPQGAGKGFNSLTDEAKGLINGWTAPDGNLELDPGTVKKFFDEVAPNMTEEQFAKFNEIASSGKNYNELVTILDNPSANGIVDIDLDGVANTAKIAGESNGMFDDEISTPTDVKGVPTGMDLSAQDNITQTELLKAAGLRVNDMKEFTDEAMSNYAKDMLGVSEYRTIQGIPMTAEEFKALDAAVGGYGENTFSAETIKYLDDNFGDRKEEVTKAAFKLVADEKGIKLPDQFNMKPEVKLPTDYEAADEMRSTMMDEVPDYASLSNENISSDQVRKLYYAVGEDEKKMNDILNMVNAGKLNGTDIEGMIDAGVSAGQTQDALFNGITKAGDANAIQQSADDMGFEDDVQNNVDTPKVSADLSSTQDMILQAKQDDLVSMEDIKAWNGALARGEITHEEIQKIIKDRMAQASENDMAF